ncbi:hypothetical protein JXB02_00255 [Candidatus Woesearchaeota archaeon]|nr:hypothetical protein [Candidatus Woesearchaeota archaeon]
MASLQQVERDIKRSFSHVRADIDDLKRAQDVQRDVIKKEVGQLREVGKAMREEIRFKLNETESEFRKRLEALDSRRDMAEDLRKEVLFLKSSMLAKAEIDGIIAEVNDLKDGLFSLENDSVRRSQFERRIGGFEGRLTKIARKAMLRESFSREARILKDLKRRVHEIEQRMVTSLDMNKEFSVRENQMKKAVAKELFEIETMVRTLTSVSEDLKKSFVEKREFDRAGKETGKRLGRIAVLDRRIGQLSERVAGMKSMFVREDQHERRLGHIEKEINLVVEDIESLEKVHQGLDESDRLREELRTLAERVGRLEGKSATKGELARDVHRMRDSLDLLKERMESESGIAPEEPKPDVKNIRKLDEFMPKRSARRKKGLISRMIGFFEEPDEPAVKTTAPAKKAPKRPAKRTAKKGTAKRKGKSAPRRGKVTIPAPSFSKRRPKNSHIFSK